MNVVAPPLRRPLDGTTRTRRLRLRVIRKGLLLGANLLGLAAFTWPFLLPAAVGGDEAHGTDGPLIAIGLLVCLGALLFVQLGRGGMGPKSVALIGVLGAAMVALRLPGFIGGFSAMFIIVLVAGNAFGPAFGFLLGAVGTFASGMFVGGFGPWLPFQMVAVGWTAAGAGLLPRPPNRWALRIGYLAAYGFVTGFLFGAIMNLWAWPYVTAGSAIDWAPQLGPAENLGHYLRYYLVTSLTWDALRAVGNVAMVLILGRPLLTALDRAAKRMNLTLH